MEAYKVVTQYERDGVKHEVGSIVKLSEVDAKALVSEGKVEVASSVASSQDPRSTTPRTTVEPE